MALPVALLLVNLAKLGPVSTGQLVGKLVSVLLMQMTATVWCIPSRGAGRSRMQLLNWLYRNVWGNLVASGITASLAYWRLKVLHKRHHAEIKQLLNDQK